MNDYSTLSDEQLKERLEVLRNKRLEKDVLQNALKISANSCYGVTASPSCMWFNRNIAEAITITGQYSVRNAARSINSYLSDVLGVEKEYAVYMDTDSCYVSLGELVSKFAEEKSYREKLVFVDRVADTKIQELLTKTFDMQRVATNCLESHLKMKREVICDQAIFLKSKHYICHVGSKEGGIHLDEPVVKMTGIAAVKTSTPTAVRGAIKKAIDLIFKQGREPTNEFIEEFREEFFEMPVEDIAFPRGVNNIGKYFDERTQSYTKGLTVPIHVRASCVYNMALDKFSVADKYHVINESDKLKFVYLRMPNALKSNVVGFASELPREFGVHDFVDYDTQFEKTFLTSLRRIFEAIGWNLGDDSALDDFF